MRDHGLIKGFTAAGAVAKHRFVAVAVDGDGVQASAATDAIIGASTVVDTASGGTLDVVMTGVAEVEAGGVVNAGDRVTADADGKAVSTTTGGDRLGGTALTDAAAGDIFPVFILPGTL